VEGPSPTFHGAWRRQLIAAAVPAALLAAAGTAVADHDHEERDGTTSTGDVDVYGPWTRTEGPSLVCPTVPYEAEAPLELLHPEPVDRLLLSGHKTTADGAVATWDDPTVTTGYESSGCGGFAEVVGLTVSGDLGYNLTG
jgi:hypothetical protein